MLEFQPLSTSILMGIGVVLIGLEMLVGTFYILWFGVGFFIVGAIQYFFPFSNGLYQISLALTISLILLLLLKNFIKKILKTPEKEIKDDFLNEAGEGVIKEGMLFYKGTLWEYEPKDLHVKNGDRVKVLSVKSNVAKIEMG